MLIFVRKRKKMRILIIGATGMIGKALVRELRAAGHQVVVSSRNADKARQIFNSDADIRKWDGRSAVALAEILAGVDGMVNLAGENIAGGLWTRKRKLRLRESRVSTGRAITDAILQMKEKPAFLIQGSATGYYGPDLPHPVNENAPLGQGFLADLTGEWEGSVSLLQDAGIRVVFIRTGVVMHPEGGMLNKMLLPFRFYTGTTLGSGKQWISWIHLLDEVRAIRFLIENKESSGPYNLVAPHPVTMHGLIAAITATIRKPAWFKIPSSLLRATMGEMATETILANQQIKPSNLLEAGFQFRFERIEPALKDLLRNNTP